ncbi:MAG TPA: endonuclease/exonuclease/phosphatase family protein [Polyangia bacterium]|jgi:endonuclease/exonuclease/phosphatase family metal-dependent hydrolase|nr:endonuclease/exonuclease/phosphatase family protein [Polyangia bacterium]
MRTEQRLEHDLEVHLPRLAGIRRRPQLLRHPLYQRLEPEIERVVQGLEWRLDVPRQPEVRPFVRAVAWNIERGKRYGGICELLRHHEILREADLLLLTEVDIGMGRSGGRNVARELASTLGYAYVYANGYLQLAPGDKDEAQHPWPAGLSLHGTALLSRFPVTRCEGVVLPEFRDRFHSFEKRLGDKRALVAEVQLPDGPLTVAVVHTDPFAPPRHRALQVERVLTVVERFGHERVLFGGDLNTNTYDLGSPLRLVLDALQKGVSLGWHGTIAEYMTPWRIFERPVFAALEEHGLSIEGVNDLSQGTLYYDVNDQMQHDKSRDFVPGPVLSYLRRKLEPWDGRVPMRIDWFAGRGLRPAPGYLPGTDLAAMTLVRPTWPLGGEGGERLSDHDPIVVDLALAPH